MKLHLRSLFLFGIFTHVAHSAATAITKTDATKRFEFNVTWETNAPDGYARSQILVNGQYPGPTIKAIQGDDVEVGHRLALSVTFFKTFFTDRCEQSNATGHDSAFSWHSVRGGDFHL